MPDTLSIKPATEKDVALILTFIKELADYEKRLHEVAATEDLIKEALFSAQSHTETLIAYLNDKPVGFAIYFYNFSTFLGRSGIYLEDLYVKPEARGMGIGKKLLAALAKLAIQKQCGRLELSVLDWNEDAIKFYQQLGAEPKNEWIVYRLTGNALTELANKY